jgi:hypothetical protein
MIIEGKISKDNINDNLQIYPFHKNSNINSSKILDDETHYLEKISQNSLTLFPHSPFCDIATEVFLIYTTKNNKNKLVINYLV